MTNSNLFRPSGLGGLGALITLTPWATVALLRSFKSIHIEEEFEMSLVTSTPTENHFNNSRCQFISSAACLSQSRARSPMTDLLAMSVGSMASSCA